MTWHGRAHRWIAFAAATWAAVFAAFHGSWAAGWYVGLDPVQAEAAFAVPWMLAYDVLVAVICAVATPVALALGFPDALRVPRRLLSGVASIGTGLLVLRATASLVQVTFLVAAGRFAAGQLSPWELWFYLGAVLFSLDLWLWRRSPAVAADSVRRSTTTRVPITRISSRK